MPPRTSSKSLRRESEFKSLLSSHTAISRVAPESPAAPTRATNPGAPFWSAIHCFTFVSFVVKRVVKRVCSSASSVSSVVEVCSCVPSCPSWRWCTVVPFVVKLCVLRALCCERRLFLCALCVLCGERLFLSVPFVPFVVKLFHSTIQNQLNHCHPERSRGTPIQTSLSCDRARSVLCP